MTKFGKIKFKPNAFFWPLLASSALSVLLLACRFLGGHNLRYWFLLWNLFLAWLPLIFAFWLFQYLKKQRWASFKGVILSVLWVGFLPNSFYLVSDFVHLKATGEVSILFDAVMFMTFAWNGLLLGFASVFIINTELLKRIRQRLVVQLIGMVFLLCSFAIYLGRYLSWNTWDIIINPGGILFDLSDRIVKPTSYPKMFTITSLFTVVLSVMYYTAYKLIGAIRGEAS